MTTKKRAGKASKKAAKASPKRSIRAAMAVATNSRKATAERVKALADAPQAILESEKSHRRYWTVVRNKDEPVEVRLEAINALATAAFAVTTFEPYRNDYIATLQEVVDDPNPEIREMRLGCLQARRTSLPRRNCLTD